ncbi:MAG: MFS transporter [Candidatus Hodarchaeales archaeon]|jgi:MFS family permease
MAKTTSVRNAYMLLFASQIVNIGFGLLAIFITLLADEIDLRPIEIGIIISIFAVARAISSGIVPAISDRTGRKIILIGALFTYAVSTTLLGFARTFEFLLVLRVIEGAAAGAAFPTAEALLVDSVAKEERGAWMGKYFTTFSFGFIIGPALGGLLFTLGRDILKLNVLTAFIVPFAFTGFLGFLATFFTILFVKDTVEVETRRFETDHDIDANTVTPYMSSFLLVGVLSGFAIGLVIPIFTLYMTDVFSLDEGSIGFVFTISGSAALLVNYPAGRLSDKINRMNIVIVGMLFAGLGFIGVAFSTSLIMVIFFFIFRQMAFQAYLPAYRAFQADKIPPMIRGREMGRIQSSFNIGSVLGPLIGAGIYEFYANRTVWVFIDQITFFGGGVPFLVAGIFGVFQVFIAMYVKRQESEKGTAKGILL